MTEQKSKGKVLPFRQGAAFYMKRGAKQMEKNDLLAALCRYRQAYASDPSNADSCLAVAEILYQMQRFEESNRLLLLYVSMYEAVPECYFGIACNYFGMHEFDYAAESLETYLSLDPNGAFAYDAEDFLDVLDDDAELAAATGISSDEDFDTLTICTRARHLLDAGEPGIAVDLLREHLSEVPRAWRAWNLLSVAQYCAGDREGAKRTTDHVLSENPDDLSALCSRILLLCTGGQKEAAAELLDALPQDLAGAAPETLSSIAVLQMELSRFEAARMTLRRLYLAAPYDTNVIHQMGYCARMLGDFDEAQRCYRRLLRLDPTDTVAKYYLASAKSAAEQPSGKAAYWSLSYRVPLPEMLRRLNHINRMFGLPQGELRIRWKTDESFRNLLNWVLTVPDDRVKRAILSFYYMMGDERALRSFLLRTDQGDALKREVLALLRRMGAKEPYMAYLESQWIQGRVSMLLLPEKLPPAYEQVLRLLMEHCFADGQQEAASYSVDLLRKYLAQFEDNRFPRISTNQEASFAAALDLLGGRLAGKEQDEQEICKRYKITQIRLRNALAKFEPFLEEY